jgi:hypothetical protein
LSNDCTTGRLLLLLLLLYGGSEHEIGAGGLWALWRALWRTGGWTLWLRLRWPLTQDHALRWHAELLLEVRRC